MDTQIILARPSHPIPPMRSIPTFVLALFLSVSAIAAESASNIAWLGFPIHGRDKQPSEINLVKDQSLGSAFLLQLRRQAVLLAAREELGALTRDAFLDEPAPENAVRIADIEQVSSADVKYTDHRLFLNELEKRSRNEFLAEWEKLGLKKSEPLQPAENADLDAECTEIETLLTEWALIPQFEAVRRTHDAIRRYGESLPLLTLLVRGYTQLQMLTNIATLDTHRVFQARAMLYAQRAVAKFDETPETLSLRAAAWSLNNFHRLAREEFAAIPSDELEKADAWTQLAKAYCEFDFKKIAAMTETLDPKTQRPLAKLLYFFLLDYSYDMILPRPFGEKAIADLPDCTRLYTGTFSINTFDMVHAPDGSPFHEHLARRIAPAVRKMRNLSDEVLDKAKQLDSTVKKPSGGLFSILGGGTPRQGFPLEQYFIDYAALLKSLSDTPQPSEPSLSMLAMLLRDDEFKIVREIRFHLRGRNDYPETYIIPAVPVIDGHPAMEFLALSCRVADVRRPFYNRFANKTIPYNRYSQFSHNFPAHVWETHSFGRFFSPNIFACLFADRENVRDMTRYHYLARTEVSAEAYMFTVDVLRSLCPKNPYAGTVWLTRGRNVNEADAEALGKEFADFPGVCESLANYYAKHNKLEKLLEIIGDDDLQKLTPALRDHIVDAYLKKNDTEKAIAILKKFLETERSQQALSAYATLQRIGKILLQQGRFEEAKEYFVPAMQTHASWGLSGMARYLEIVGEFDDAEKLHLADRKSYPESGPFALWAFRYSTNRAALQESTDEILQKYAQEYAQYKANHPTTQDRSRRGGYQTIYPCYCLDLPYPDPLGEDPFVEEFLRSGEGMLGFIAWFDAKEKGDEQKAARLLRLLRELWFLDEKSDPFVAAQRTVSPNIPNRIDVALPIRMLAALIELDQRKPTPGQLNQEEVDFLLRTNFRHDLEAGWSPWLLYLIGRYYALCDEKEKAIDCWRRVLGFRADFNYFLRCLAVKELRKSGMTDEEYINWSQGDPGMPRQSISYSYADVFCRQHFRDYSESPSASVLAGPIIAKPDARTEAVNLTQRTPGWYKVTSVQFRGETIPETETVVYWMVPEEKEDEDYRYWRTSGIAACSLFLTLPEKRQDDGTYSLRFGEEKDGLPALAVFRKDELTLFVSLKPDESPDDTSPYCVRVDMKKVADIPTEEPMIPVAERNVQTHVVVPHEMPRVKIGETSDWTRHARLAAVATAGGAIVLALIISVAKKRRRSEN